jgi:CheY-like chemotaxis protein
MTGLVLTDDLLYSSRLTATARAAGATVVPVRDPAALAGRAAGVAAVFLDLHTPGLDVAACVADLRKLTPAPRIIAYGSHVATETLRAARDAGCDEVLPRSAFADRLESDLPRWLAMGE